MTRIADPAFRLRNDYTPPPLPPEPNTGLKLDALHRPALELADYIHRQLADPPAAICGEPRPETGDGARHTLAATVAVNPVDVKECRIAIDEFVDLQIALALPMTAQGQQEWTVVGDGKTGHAAPGSWGGHGVVYREYDPETFKCLTWGVELLLSVPFHAGYARQAHVMVTWEMLSRQGIGPSGVNWDELTADIKALPRQPNDGRPAGAPLFGPA